MMIVIILSYSLKFFKIFMSNNLSPVRILPRLNILMSTAIVAVMASEALANESSSDNIRQLPTVTVVEKKLQNDGMVDGYKTGASRSSTRTDTPLLDVPQSISVVTQDQIRDQNITSIGEAIRYVPGLRFIKAKIIATK